METLYQYCVRHLNKKEEKDDFQERLISVYMANFEMTREEAIKYIIYQNEVLK